ncbi:MAG: S-methyl-5-thioribose-1-phosphate isomerase [Verrucomicrobiota bacterium]
MQVGGQHYRTIWFDEDEADVVNIIDQRKLPFCFEIEKLRTLEQAAVAIKDMHVRGAGCVGATAGYGMFLAAKEALKAGDFEPALRLSAQQLMATRPTAVNLQWAVERQLSAVLAQSSSATRISCARQTAQDIADEDVEACAQIGQHGLELIRQAAAKKTEGEAVNILTHCNAGWLAFVDHGSATAPIYAAQAAGIAVHVWVDETRPRNQGARLTAWELEQAGVPYTLIVDNVGGHLMQHGQVDMVITGTDRTTYTGDVANKIGTYLKALAAFDNAVPFYVALPSSTFDWELADGVNGIPIEERGGDEVTKMEGRLDGQDEIREFYLVGEKTPAANYAFDVTPARLVSKLITERGICAASAAGVGGLFPERKTGG